MSNSKLLLVIFAVAIGLFLLAPSLSWADDGGALYKAKCAVCHGVDATGKPALKAPSLVSPEAKKATDADLTDAIANGGKAQKATHQFSKKGMTPDQIKMVVAYIRSLQK